MAFTGHGQKYFMVMSGRQRFSGNLKDIMKICAVICGLFLLLQWDDVCCAQQFKRERNMRFVPVQTTTTVKPDMPSNDILVDTQPISMDKAPKRVMQWAEWQLSSALRALPETTLKKWGCTGKSVEEFLTCASLDEPLQIYEITPATLSYWREGGTVKSIVSAADVWYIPVRVNSEIRLVLRTGGSFRERDWADERFVGELNKILKQWPKSKGYSPVLINVCQGDFNFTIPEKGPYNLTAIRASADAVAPYADLDTVEKSVAQFKPKSEYMSQWGDYSASRAAENAAEEILNQIKAGRSEAAQDVRAVLIEKLLEAVRAGGPYRLYKIMPSTLLNYRKGDTVNSLVVATDAWYFPVWINGDSSFLLPVLKTGDKWEAGEPGLENLLRNLKSVRRQWPRVDGYQTMLVEVLPGRYYFTIPEKGAYNLTEIPSLPGTGRGSYAALDSLQNVIERLNPEIKENPGPPSEANKETILDNSAPLEVVDKAKGELYAAFLYIGEETQNEWGCLDGISACAVLAEPLRVYRVAPDMFKQYRKGSRVNAIVSATDTWYFPVVIKGSIKLVLEVGKFMYADGTGIIYARPPINGADLAAELDKVVRHWPKAKGYNPVLIEGMPGDYLFTVPEKGAYNLTSMATLPYMQSRDGYSQLDTVDDYMARPAPAKIKINADLETPVAGLNAFKGLIGWKATKQELYKDGSWIVEFGSRTIAVKPGFVRGDYDASAHEYKMQPVAMISDVTDGGYNGPEVYEYAYMGSANCYPIATPAGFLYFKLTAEELTIAKCAKDNLTTSTIYDGVYENAINVRPDFSFHKTISYKEWLGHWTQYAAKYCGSPIKDYCFVPQALARKGYFITNTPRAYAADAPWTYRYGFVVSKYGVSSSGINVPSDFVELFGLGKTGYPPNAASPSESLIFKFNPRDTERLEWQIYSTTDRYLMENGTAWKSDRQRIYELARESWIEIAKQENKYLTY